MNKFKERLKELLKETTVKQIDIAKSIGISKQTLSNYKSGYSEPGIDELILLSNYFGVSIDYLVGRQDWY